MKLNVKQQPKAFTYEGAPAVVAGAHVQLRRALMSCLLWEDQFYEGGQSIADRIVSLVPQVDATDCMNAAVDARQRFKLRHAPLLIASAMAKLPTHKVLVAHTLEQIVDRPDEITEFLAIHAKLNGVTPDKVKKTVSAQIKKGLAAAFNKFNEYSLAKYDRDGAVKLRDALFLVHAKPKDAPDKLYTRVERKDKPKLKLTEGEALFKRLVDGELVTPETWEVELSAGADKKATFTHLILDKKLGALAFLRNLRNMSEAGVDRDIVAAYSHEVDVRRVLPFRFIAAARHAPQWEPFIEQMMFRCVQGMERMSGATALLIDHSGSMENVVSAKSEITRFDAAAAVAMVTRELCDNVRVFTFSDRCIEVPARRGFAMRDAVKSVVNPVGTLLGKAVRHVYATMPECERLIVITDEQSHDKPPQPQGRGYIINVGGYQNGVGFGTWTTINGWSEAILDFMRELENEQENMK